MIKNATGGKCPFIDGDRAFEIFTYIQGGLGDDHSAEDCPLYQGLGDFWGPGIAFARRQGRWPRLSDIIRSVNLFDAEFESGIGAEHRHATPAKEARYPADQSTGHEHDSGFVRSTNC
jgi:hypothetical protein